MKDEKEKVERAAAGTVQTWGNTAPDDNRGVDSLKSKTSAGPKHQETTAKTLAPDAQTKTTGDV